MTDAGLKKLLGFLLRNKPQIMKLLDHFRAEDIEHGILAIPQDLINRDLKMLIMEKTDPYLSEYTVQFDRNSIFLTAEAEIKQLGKLNAHFMLTVESFTFHHLQRKIIFNYQEDVKSNGSMLQNLTMKAAGLKGSYLQTAAEIARFPFLTVANNQIILDLDKLNWAKKVPSELTFTYESCEEGTLKLKFSIN